jgi:hypothetical protein
LTSRQNAEAVLLLFSALTIVVSFGCGNQSAPTIHESVKREQVLPLTLGGFLKDGTETEQVKGVCGTDSTRNLLNCDIYNGLPGWTITEVTLAVTCYPYEENSARYYQAPNIIKPRTAEHVSVRLGLQLPLDDVLTLPHGKVKARKLWAWQIVGAKGYPVE